MFQETANNSKEEKRRSMKGLLTWLVLIPLILGTLICCGQLATLNFLDKGRYTSSLLTADYRPWPYEKIPAINAEAFMRDLQEETATVVIGAYWIFPSKTVYPIAQVTENPNATSTPVPSDVRTPTPTRFITITPTVPTSTQRATSTILPTITHTVVVPSITATRTLPPPPAIPTATNTHRPPPPRPTGTFTPTPTSTVTTIVATTVTPTNTSTPTLPTPATTEVTPEITFTVTPTYAPVRPIAENDGIADQMPNNGCRAYFGYRNDNPSEVDIEVGTQNNLNDPATIDNPPQPTHFQVGRVFGAFEFTWYSGLTLIWTLDGRTATANWCYP